MLPLHRPKQRANGDHHRDLADAFDLLVEFEHCLSHVIGSVLWIDRHCRNILAGVERCHLDRHGGFFGRCAMHAHQMAQRHTGREYRQKTVGVNQQSHAIRQPDQSQRQEIVQSYRFLVLVPQVQHQTADGQTQEGANAQARQ